jgi:predicted RNase H-like nuclease (RuvC/YqgF family)
MSKEATIIQTYNDEKRIHEYFVKGFDVSESIRVLLKAHKEAYDNERRVFAECKGYLDAEKEFKERISELEAKLAEKNKEIEVLKQRLKDTIKIYSDDFVEKDKELKELRFQARNIFPLVENLEDKVNQDKIEFAVEQLEQLRHDIWINQADDGYTDMQVDLYDLNDTIDVIIMQIKEGK